jgi:hypothetical protein
MSVGASALMHIKILHSARPNLPSARKRDSAMPTETAVVIAATVAAFAIYAAALAWADYYSHHQPKA